jgi:hypothetical protein
MLNPSAGETPDWRRRWSLLLAKIERVQSPAQGQALLDELSRPTRALGAGFCQCARDELHGGVRALF